MDPNTLQSIDVFAGLDPEVRAELAGVLVERSLQPGEAVFSEGDPGDTLYAIAEGMIRIQKRISADGPASKTLSLLTRGELFGEMSVLDSRPRSASAVADGPARLLCLPRTTFEGILTRNPRNAVALLSGVMRAMNERIRRLNAGVVAYDEVGRAIGSCDRLPPLLEQVLGQLLNAVGASLGVIFLESEFHRTLEPRGLAGISLDAVPTERPGDRASLAAHAMQSAAGWVVSDRDSDDRCRPFARRPWELRSLLLTPIAGSGGVLGLLILGHPEPHRFDVNHLNLAEGIARQTAQAIVNLRHREEQQSRARLGRQMVKF